MKKDYGWLAVGISILVLILVIYVPRVFFGYHLIVEIAALAFAIFSYMRIRSNEKKADNP